MKKILAVATALVLAISSLCVFVFAAEGSASGVIYVNEDYHALIINGNFISSAHVDDDGDGVCDVCKAEVESEGVAYETVTVGDVEYAVVFSNDLNAASGNWNSYTLGDSSFAAALSVEGSYLVIERDTETVLSYVDGQVWDKFIISASSNVQLGTNGTTAEDEDVVAFVSDDGLTVVYDGATVYAAMEAAGIEGSSSYSLISNSSASYTITSVKVLVPADAVSVEEVEVSDPQESGETDSEDDGEDLTVDDSEPETPAETNPTTGAVLALVPMAIAGLAVVASKRR
ncbi:MAG: hypothetical protein LUC38_02470 [Oscillospiraceae bacterium]|nr:hypothetical protein [Ruminococcus sp.]MCD8344811.1 hypothetical protein [Oscillospiraceae bacterium]